MSEIIFHGATGSCHIVRANGRTVLLDCGLFQGHRADVQAKNHVLPVPIEALDAIVLSHAHIDHAGAFPFSFTKGSPRPSKRPLRRSTSPR